jgi:hypothetical protein
MLADKLSRYLSLDFLCEELYHWRPCLGNKVEHDELSQYVSVCKKMFMQQRHAVQVVAGPSTDADDSFSRSKALPNCIEGPINVRDSSFISFVAPPGPDGSWCGTVAGVPPCFRAQLPKAVEGEEGALRKLMLDIAPNSELLCT